MTTPPVRWFHGSPHHINVGDIVQCGVRPSNFIESSTISVSLTSEPDKALYWASKCASNVENCQQVYVYEVQPLSDITIWRTRLKNFGQDIAYEEVRVDAARVSRVAFGPETSTLETENSRVVHYTPLGKIFSVQTKES